jgi:hypothetical protein
MSYIAFLVTAGHHSDDGRIGNADILATVRRQFNSFLLAMKDVQAQDIKIGHHA